jgi:hypothetical protein
MNIFSAPIPGQSLTAEPRNYPWENPMMTADPEKAIQYHIERISRPEAMDSLLTLLELGMSVRALTESMLTSATMNGIHDPDVSMLIGPVIHEQIKKIAEYSGVEFEEGFGRPQYEKDNEEKELLKSRVRSKLNKGKPMPEATEEALAAPVEELVAPTQEEAPTKQGLMARRNM